MSLKKQINLMWAFLVALGLYLCWGAIGNYIESKQSMKWPDVEGLIVSSRIETGISGGIKGGSLEHTPVVSYSYRVDGIEYEGKRIRTGKINTLNREMAFDIKKKYSAGTKVHVYYDPKEPSKSVLEPGRLSDFLLKIVIGPSALILGIILLIKRKKILE